MTDYYKILNLSHNASESEIKNQFRKLVAIYHPDKNGGSKTSEEAFKMIVAAYEILSDSNKRAIYNFEYIQYINIQKSDIPNQNKRRQNPENATHSTWNGRQNMSNQNITISKYNVGYIYLFISIIILLVYLYNTNRKISTGIEQSDEQFEQGKQERPPSGELDFKNN